MNAHDYLRVAPFINDCPTCGNDIVGKDEGVLEVKDNWISRSCKCGFHFAYDVNQGTTRAKIKKAVEAAKIQVR